MYTMRDTIVPVKVHSDLCIANTRPAVEDILADSLCSISPQKGICGKGFVREPCERRSSRVTCATGISASRGSVGLPRK